MMAPRFDEREDGYVCTAAHRLCAPGLWGLFLRSRKVNIPYHIAVARPAG